ncbi:hypothetical protein DNHGIG_10300 [Collibacillus ludicampi]|uniref:Uncharacterized protein n=1 Tax=Collibacillus ludicampi TaxID=2771369 RepID=A0AAV4LCK3_9BACL|nr:hypothetical protein [Collibacillus ludicampi]GIM45481.1 hypothetical protein DNHGIG_10300 [Collibacillus ludicampi]
MFLDIEHEISAFHGTDEESAINICSSGFQIPKVIRDDHWLGPGVYFFRDDYIQARIWGKTKIERTPELHGKKLLFFK